MITENSSQVIIDGFKEQLNVSLHHNEDPKLIEIVTQTELSNKAIEIDGRVFVILSVSNSICILDQPVPDEIKLSTMANLCHDYLDLLELNNDNVTLNLNTLIFKKNLIVNGGIYFQDLNLYFMNSTKIHINSG